MTVGKTVKLIVSVLLAGLLVGSAYADDWGSWDDLPDNLLENTEASDLSDQLDRLLAASPDQLPDQLEQWLFELNVRFEYDAKDLDDLFDELLDSDRSEWSDEFEDWLEDQQDALEDEIDELDDIEIDSDDDEIDEVDEIDDDELDEVDEEDEPEVEEGGL